mgnify:CR=1 FL=1
MTTESKEPMNMINYLVRFHLGAESGFQGTWKLHGAGEEIYKVLSTNRPLSADPTQILAATTVIVHMINAMNFYHND